ncbi:MAG: VOC family protein [Phenylobacterium sp.]
MDDRARLPTIGPLIWYQNPRAAIAWGGRTTQSVHVQLREGLDAHCERARAAGASIAREPATQPYGDRVYTCTDLEDHSWSFGQTMKVLSNAEVAEATGHRITGQEA